MFTSQMPMQTSTSAPQILPPEQRLPIDEGAEQDIHHRVHEPEDGNPADGVVLHQQGPDDIARAADERQIKQHRQAQSALRVEAAAQCQTDQQQSQPAHEQIEEADRKAVRLFRHGLVPRTGQGKNDRGQQHTEHAPGASAAVVADGADDFTEMRTGCCTARTDQRKLMDRSTHTVLLDK